MAINIEELKYWKWFSPEKTVPKYDIWGDVELDSDGALLMQTIPGNYFMGRFVPESDLKSQITAADEFGVFIKESGTGVIKTTGLKLYTKSETYNQTEINNFLIKKEDKSNKVTTVSNTSTDTQYPSAKLLYDQLATKEDKSNKTQTIAVAGLTSNDKYPSETAVRTLIDQLYDKILAIVDRSIFTVDITSLSFNPEGESKSVNVTSTRNGNVELWSVTSKPDWITVLGSTFTASENNN
jgi:hypothetical protein